MSKQERIARYEYLWGREYRPIRRFKRAPRPYWQTNPNRTWYQRKMRRLAKLAA